MRTLVIFRICLFEYTALEASLSSIPPFAKAQMLFSFACPRGFVVIMLTFPFPDRKWRCISGHIFPLSNVSMSTTEKSPDRQTTLLLLLYRDGRARDEACRPCSCGRYVSQVNCTLGPPHDGSMNNWVNIPHGQGPHQLVTQNCIQAHCRI